MTENMFGDLANAVVDIIKEIMAVDDENIQKERENING